ncbi:hypothetical protein FACS189419_04890 [Planctomycetales bacterium]|nr:hypothetical protein FACS189419_04890 [Planctomycetales bacterium]
MNNENKYKAPWTVCHQKNGMYRVESTERTIANYLHECEADIIAAAPEMLEVLEKFVKWDKDYPVIGTTSWNGFNAFNKIIDKAKNIIAKAKGETNERRS